MRFFDVLRSHKKFQILKYAGREADMRHSGGKAEILREMHPKSLEGHVRFTF
jgi:hypothetical protein